MLLKQGKGQGLERGSVYRRETLVRTPRQIQESSWLLMQVRTGIYDMQLRVSKRSFFILGFILIFSVVAFSLSPGYDQYDLGRHYTHIESISGLNYAQVVERSAPGYLLFDSYAWLIDELGLSKRFFTASVVYLAYLLIFSVWLDLIRRSSHAYLNLSQKTKTVIFLIFWLSIAFVSISSGIRNGLANAVMFYVGYRLIFYDRVFLFVMGTVIAYFIHPFSLAAAVILTGSYFGKNLITIRLCKAIIIFSFLFLLFQPLVKKVVDVIQVALGGYSFFKASYLDFDGQWGAAHAETRNFNGLLAVYLFSKLPVYVAVVYFLFIPSKSVISKSVFFLISILFLYFCVLFDFYTLVGRMTYLYVYFITLFFALQLMHSRTRYDYFFVLAYFVSLSMYSVFNVYSYRALIFSYFT